MFRRLNDLDHYRERILRLHEEGYSHDEIGKIIAHEIGRKVQFQPVSIQARILEWKVSASSDC